jgi:hypothetical protein
MGDLSLESMNKILFLITGCQHSRHAEMKCTEAIQSGAMFSENSLRATY